MDYTVQMDTDTPQYNWTVANKSCRSEVASPVNKSLVLHLLSWTIHREAHNRMVLRAFYGLWTMDYDDDDDDSDDDYDVDGDDV